MTSDLPLYLLGVFVISFMTNLCINKFYKIKIWKLFVFTVLSTILGAFSTMFMSYLESGSFKGTSFYGAVFLMPIFAVVLAYVFKEKKGKFLNFTALLGMSTSALLKCRCLVYGCCGGRRLPIYTKQGFLIFPSQIAEMLLAIIIFLILVLLFIRRKDRIDLYPVMLVSYGIGRFILNTFRRVEPVLFNFSFGHIWSILAVIIGLIWLYILHDKKKYEK